MKKVIALLFFWSMVLGTYAQNSTNSSVLSKTDTENFFTTAFKKKYLINFPIFRAYTYNDKSGNYYVALTESADTISKEKDTVNYTIKAFNFKVEKNVVQKKWEINDFRLAQVKGLEKEGSIWFWTKYCDFRDLDDDGLVDPIIVYGTFGINGYDDGRAKILIYHNGQKTAIRHQNSIADSARKTQIDAGFYALPAKIQDYIKSLMGKMVNNKHAIFPSNYLEKMEKKEVMIGN